MSSFTRFSSSASVEYALAESMELGRDLWRVTTPFRYYLGTEDTGRYISIPAGYLTDGASVPRVLWSIVPPWGRYGQAAIVHDFLCEYLTIVDNGCIRQIARKEADMEFARAMEALQVPQDLMDKINLAVKGYRVITRTDKAVWHRDKAKLEAAWAALKDANLVK